MASYNKLTFFGRACFHTKKEANEAVNSLLAQGFATPSGKEVKWRPGSTFWGIQWENDTKENRKHFFYTNSAQVYASYTGARFEGLTE